MRSLNQIARTLSGRTRLEERAELASSDTYTLIGVATTDSANGSVRIRLTDSVTRAGWDEEGTDIEVPTNGHVREGQRVYVTCFGGSMQEMVVSGAVGEGDELRADVNTALSEAEIAHEAAEAAVEDAGLAKQAAQQAAGSAESAATSAANAASSASNAEADARRAEQSADSAQSSASTAATAASNAQTSAGQAASSASAAAQSASDAQGSAATAASAAQQATQDAAEALRQSGLAQTAADTAIEQSGRAETAARQATTHANSALVQLSTVEDVIGTVNWIAEHGEYVKTTDTAIDPDKVYYVKQGDLYHPVAEPDVADISTYYELHVDDALSNFVASHLALTDAGLYVLKDADAWKTLVRNDGFEVQDPAGVAAISVDGATGIGFDANRPMRIGTDSAFIIFTPASGSDPATIQIGGANVQIGGLSPSELAGSRIWTATADPTTPNYTFARSALTGASGVPRVGDLVVRGYYRYTVSSVASSSVLTGNRTSIRGATGAQGPQGPQGEQGPQGAAGHSPEVTSTKNADGSVTIYVDGTATSTVDAGEDGHSPTVTTTKNADGSVTIYVDGTASSTVEAGTDGTSYYTYVRYSKNANGSGMVTTPTAETKYIGVYTGTSASVPAYTSFNWSKYVGDDAAPLTVTATSVDYILSTSGTNPPADSASWQASPLAPTTTQYLWTRTTLTFSDGTTAKSYSIGGKVGEKGDSGPEAYVTIVPSNVNWTAGTATLTATLHVDGTKVTPTKYEWAKGDTALSATGNQCGVTDLNATYSCTCTWSGGKQRGTIDFAMSNSVKLAAEAGWESDLAGYYTKSEVDVEVGKVSSTVSETQKSLATVGNPNLSPFFSMDLDNVYNSEKMGTDGYWQGNNSSACTKLSDGWVHYERSNTTSSNTWLTIYEHSAWRHAHGDLKGDTTYTVLMEFRNVAKTGNVTATGITQHSTSTPSMFASSAASQAIEEGASLYFTAKTVADPASVTGNTCTTRTLITIPPSSSIECDLRISLYEGEYDGPYKPYVDQTLAERVTQAETDIEQNATDITLRATKTEAYQSAQPNLTPFYSVPYDDSSYWVLSSPLIGTADANGWCDISLSSVSSTQTLHIRPKRSESVIPSKKYTMLFEYETTSKSGSVKWMYKPNDAVAQIATDASGTVDLFTEHATYIPMTAVADAISNTNRTSLCAVVLQLAAGATFVGRIRVSLYEGEYSGPYKSYSGPQLYSTRSELKVTAAGITSTVEKISSYKYCETTYRYSLAHIKVYSAEGYTDYWNVSQDYNLRVGDTAYLKVYDVTRECDVYIKGTIVSMPSATRIRMTSHGYEDVLPVDTIKSTINQSSDSVKIQAKHIEIDGTAIFNNTNFQSNLTTKLDSIKVGGTNLLRGTGTGEGWGYTSFDKETRTFTRSTTATGESYIWCESRSYLMYELGTEYVLSCWAKSNGQVKDMDIFTYDQNTKNIKSRTCSVTTEWTYFIFPFKYDAWSTSSATPTGFLVRFDNNGSKTSGTEAILYVRDVKLERGNKATDWSPAPEDQTAYVDSVQVGGRNLLLGTSDQWSEWITPAYNASNSTKYFYMSKSDEMSTWAKAGQSVACSFEIEFSGVTKSSSGTFLVRSQDAFKSAADSSLRSTGDNVDWNDGAAGDGDGKFYVTTPPADGVHRVENVHAFDADHSGRYALVFCIRCDYWASGKYRIRKVKYEVGNRVTDWSQAPEDATITTFGTNYKKFKDVASYTGDGSKSGPLVIVTPILPNHMVTVSVSGYNYTRGAETIDLNISFYNYTTNFHQYGYVNYGTRPLTPIKLAKVSSSDKRAVIIIGDASTSWSYPKALVSEVTIGNDDVPDSYASGWEMSIQSSYPTDYIELTDITEHGSNFKSQIKSAQDTADSAIKRSQRIYYRSSTDQPPTAMPTAWVTETGDKWAANRTTASNWTTKVTPISNGTGASVTKYLYLWTCLQYQLADNSDPKYTTVLLDDSTTVIDGGKIITGSLQANSINASSGTFAAANIPNLNASKITAGNIAAARIKTHVIEAINSLTAGKIDADRINVDEISIGQSQVDGLENDFEEMSGNLLGNTRNSAWTEQNVATASNTYGDVTPYNTMSVSRSVEAYDDDSNAVVINNDTATGNRGVGWFTKKGAVKAGTKYTFSCMVWASRAVTVQTRTGYRSSETSSYAGWTGYGSKSIAASTWTEYSCTLTPASSANLTWEYIAAICFTGNASGVTFKVAHAKLEFGDTATPWDIRISDAAKTATTYLTDGGSSGLMVHPSNDANTGVRITSDVDIVRAGNVMNRIDESGMTLYDGGGTADNNVVATFASDTIELGKNNANAVIKLCGDTAQIKADADRGHTALTGSSIGLASMSDQRIGMSFTGGEARISVNKKLGVPVQFSVRSNYGTMNHAAIEVAANYLLLANISGLNPDQSTVYQMSDIITAFTAITTGTLSVDRIPNLAASKITSGTFATDRIPSLAAGKITSGTFDAARVPSLAASKITSGTFDKARVPNVSALNGIFVGSKNVTFSGQHAQLFTKAEATALTGVTVKGSNAMVSVCSGDSSYYMGTMTAELNGDGIIRVSLDRAVTGTVTVNYQITLF